MIVECIITFAFMVFVILIIKRKRYNNKKKHVTSLRTLICIGSGGHTAEMLRILSKMDFDKYNPRLYIMAKDDIISEQKVMEFEQCHSNGKHGYSIKKIQRSRRVGQSYLTSIPTTIYSALDTVPIVFNFLPEVIICNGPGTCIPMCVISAVLRFLTILDCKIVFIESICRVKTLSLSGKILLYLADVFVVQWKELADYDKRMLYFGRLS